MKTLTFYFDFVSPYSYLAWKRLLALRTTQAFDLRSRPVLLAALLTHSGTLGPAEVPARRAFIFHDVFRFAARHHLPMSLPAAHPFNSVTALRVALADVSAAHQHEVIDACFSLAWEQGGDLAAADQLEAALSARGLEARALMATTAEPTVKDALKRETANAIDRGVFGVPTFVADDELFFGNDRLEDALARLRGEDPLDENRRRALDAELAGLPVGAKRAR